MGLEQRKKAFSRWRPVGEKTEATEGRWAGGVRPIGCIQVDGFVFGATTDCSAAATAQGRFLMRKK